MKVHPRSLEIHRRRRRLRFCRMGAPVDIADITVISPTSSMSQTLADPPERFRTSQNGQCLVQLALDPVVAVPIKSICSIKKSFTKE